MTDSIVEWLREWDDGRISTHYEGCMDAHPVCAILFAADAIEARDAEIERLMDGMEWAWAIIANGQYWDATDAVRHPEWEQAKFKWRDEHWHPALDRNSRNKEARRG